MTNSYDSEKILKIEINYIKPDHWGFTITVFCFPTV